MDDFNKQKIIYPNMTKYLPFVLDWKQFATNQKCFIITGENLDYLCAFLNSSLFKYCYKDNFPELQGGTRELSKVFFNMISVMKVDPAINERFEMLLKQAQSLPFEKDKIGAILRTIDYELFNLYGLADEERNRIGFIEI